MTNGPPTILRPLLHRQLMWVINMRWLAGAAIIVFDVIQWTLGPFFYPPGVMILVGASLLATNAFIRLVSVRVDKIAEPGILLSLGAWLQLIADLVALTVLAAVTGGISSPAIGFFVFPMIFASLFLSRAEAYGAALLAIAMVTISLALTNRWPADGLERLTIVGWALTLFLSVFLLNRIARGLFRREHERLEQSHQLREMNERLEAQKQAMQSLEKLVTIGQLAAGVAHEISNPLASMDGLLQLMQRSPDKPRPGAVAQLREQVERISVTLRQMTSLGHPDLGLPEPVDINRLVADTVEILGYDRRLRDINISLDLAEQIDPITARPRALQQILMNLIFNAADAVVEQADPSIRVTTHLNSSACLIQVADNGHGIEQSERERIFDAFVTTKPEGAGTGLGLPISRDLVSAHGGTLTCNPHMDGGSVFTIRLPSKPDGGIE